MTLLRDTKLFVDYMSQPSRACAIFCRTTGQPVQEVLVLLHKGEQRKPEFTQRNPLAKVPLLEAQTDNGPLELPETGAILSLLADVNQVPEHWLPRSDRVARAQVEAALHWWHGSIRAGAMRLMFNKVLAVKLGGKPSEAIAAEGLFILKRELPNLEKVWLAKGAQPFMCGSQPCIADLVVCCELEQLTMLNKALHGTDMDEMLSGHPHIRRWMAAVAAATAPHYEKVHTTLRRAAALGQGCASPSQALPQARL